MKKRKTQTKKTSISRILGYVLLGFVVIGIVANVINANKSDDEPKEEDPIEDILPGDDSEPGDDLITMAIETMEGSITIQYELGMTWSDWIDSEYNTIRARVYMNQIALSDGAVLQNNNSIISPEQLIDNSDSYCFSFGGTE